uniref:Uncharacterized protein n=1 Tax=Daphnia galeata TaxID=27404 RepID=A0A8J2RNA1_9CRUS|nr:unnamed protein product [Daphnia galeata]
MATQLNQKKSSVFSFVDEKQQTLRTRLTSSTCEGSKFGFGWLRSTIQAGVPFVNYGQGYDDDDDISEVATHHHHYPPYGSRSLESLASSHASPLNMGYLMPYSYHNGMAALSSLPSMGSGQISPLPSLTTPPFREEEEEENVEGAYASDAIFYFVEEEEDEEEEVEE